MDPVRTAQALLDKTEITDLVHAYCYHFDRAEAGAVVSLFTNDAVIDYGPDLQPMTGPAEFGPMIARGLSELFAATSHHVSNFMIRLDGADEATSVCYLYAWHLYQKDAKESELWGQYHHAFRRTPEGWKISRLMLRAAGTRNFHRENMHPIGRETGTPAPE